MPREELDKIYRPVAVTFTTLAALYYAAVALVHFFTAAPPHNLALAAKAALTMAVILVLRRELRRGAGDFSCVELTVAATFLLADLNVISHALLLQNSERASYLPIMAVGFALLAPSARTALFALALQAGAACLLFGLHLPTPSTSTVFIMATALAAGWITSRFSLGVTRNLMSEKFETERLRREAEQWAGELESRVAQRTAELEAQKLRAEAASRAKSQFLAMMSHELRTPLNAIVGYAGIVKEDVEAGVLGDCVKDLNHIESAAEHLLGLITEVLDFARSEAGQMRVLSAPVDVLSISNLAIDAVAPSAKANGNTCELVADASIGAVQGDERRVRQCLINLLANAAKFTHDGAIELRVRAVDEAIRFEVRDTGIGIAPDHLERIFDPFYQVDSSNSRSVDGTGLGLALTRQIARAMGGDVRVESAPGRGSCFTLTLPHVTSVANPEFALS